MMINLFQINTDSGVIVTSVIVLGIFTYSFYNNIFNTVHNTSNTNINLDSTSELAKTTSPSIDSLPNPVEAGVQTSDKSLWNLFKDWIWEKYAGLSESIFRTPTDSRVENSIENLNTTQSTLSQDVISVDSDSYFPELLDVIRTGLYDIEAEKDLYDLLVDSTNVFEFTEIIDGVYTYTVTIADHIVLTVE